VDVLLFGCLVALVVFFAFLFLLFVFLYFWFLHFLLFYGSQFDGLVPFW